MVVFGSIINEGYVNIGSETLHCVFNKNNDACNYGVTIGLIAFLACIFFFVLEMRFQQISSVKDRKKAVLLEIAFSGKACKIIYIWVESWSNTFLCCSSVFFFFKVCTYMCSEIYLTFDVFWVFFFLGLWTFLWFVGFCFLANQWQRTTPDKLPLNQGADAARAVIAFSFFSIFTWVSAA